MSKIEFSESNLLYCKAFRRLGDKTQMINYQNQVHFRNRMTHSLEVSAIADEIAKKINKDNNIVDRVLLREMCLCHDLGHTPYGHIGERKINSMLESEGFGFKHNVFSYKLLEENFEGVCWEILDGVLKHTKVFYKEYLKDNKDNLTDIYQIKESIVNMVKENELLSNFFKIDQLNDDEIYSKYMMHKDSISIEGQILAISDAIAQRASDLDDAFRIIRIEKMNRDNPAETFDDGKIKIDISDDPFSKTFVKLCNVKYYTGKINDFLQDLKKMYNDTSRVNVNYNFVTKIRDFFIVECVESLDLRKLKKYSFKNQLIYQNYEVESLDKKMENIFQGDETDSGFIHKEKVKEADDLGENNITKLYELYDDFGKCIYARDKISLARKGTNNKSKKISTIEDVKLQSQIKFIVLEEIAKMTNAYVENEINKYKEK